MDLPQLVARARQGDRGALEAVLAAIAPAIHRFGRRMCKSAHDADDVLQDTLVNVALHLAEFEGRSSLSSWVFALTRNACARKRRGLKNRPPMAGEFLEDRPADAPSPEARAADRQLGAALTRALDELPEDQREVILLRDVEGLSAPEAAAAIGIGVEALKSRLHRARTALRAALRPVLEPRTVDREGCPEVAALWSRKLEGDLTQTDCATIERHLRSCPSCAAACDGLKKALVACQAVRGEDVPDAVQARVKIAMRELVARADARPDHERRR
jgi:RNA polymerase sigma-70 factor (ECF subfamily)